MIQFDADGVVLGLDIQNNDKPFLDVTISLEGDYIHYSTSGELMEYGDLIELKYRLNDLLENKIENMVIVAGAEPDWYFKIYPMVEEPYIELSVCFYNEQGEMTPNEFTLALIGDEVTQLRDYIVGVLDE